MQYDLIVRGGTVVTQQGAPSALDIAVTGGRIAALLAPGTPADAAAMLDATGRTVLPGALDVHLHLGHGNDISRPRVASDAISETAAAAAGGITTFIPYLLAAEEHTTYLRRGDRRHRSGQPHRLRLSPDHLDRGSAGRGAALYAPNYGVPSFKIFMNNRGGEGARLGLPDIDDGFLYRLAEACAAQGGMVCPHPENIEVAQYLRRQVMAADPDGNGGLAAWNATRPPFVEADAIQRAARLCRAAGSADLRRPHLLGRGAARRRRRPPGRHRRSPSRPAPIT